MDLDGEPFKYYPGFITQENGAEYYHKLVRELDFKQSEIYMYNRPVPEPRLGTYHSTVVDNPTNGTRYIREIQPFTKTLEELRQKVSKFLGIEFNSVLVNLYRNGDDHVGMHADREEKGKPIASLSFGATRKFRLRKIYKTKGYDFEFHLESGDLLIMKDNCQKVYKHGVPKEKGVRKPRLNLTFRIF
jgi:alkylated DNA repair dioxygenase AlkB